MSAALIAKIRKARETKVKVEKYTFTVKRPTDLEMLEISMKKLRQMDILEGYVIDWEGVTEIDIVSSGTDIPAVFTKELFNEWIADQPALWGPITEAIVNAYGDYQKRVTDAKKK
jgi:hypothetical protein